jgi:hypothetical protein
VGVIREVDARRRVGRAPGGIDAEGTDFPVGGNGPDQKEDKNQRAKEQKDAEAPPPAPARLPIRARCVAARRRGDDGLGDRRRRNGGRILRRRGNGCGNRHSRLYLGVLGFDRGTRSGGGGATGQLLELGSRRTDWGEGLRRYRWGSGGSIRYRRLRQLGKPILQLCLIGSLILRWDGTPWEAHVRPK